MKLYYSGTSPYVRKVVVLALETGQDLQRIDTVLNPINPNTLLNADNPLGKIPALVTDDDQVLYDSRVICEYLDTLHQGPRLFPTDASRWDALRRQALADGILDAAVTSQYERALRPDALRWDKWMTAQQDKMTRALNQLESSIGDWASRFDIGTIAIACALGYLDFRYPELQWQAHQTGLGSWYQQFSKRPSMTSTVPAA